jgi:hypothetical protein
MRKTPGASGGRPPPVARRRRSGPAGHRAAHHEPRLTGTASLGHRGPCSPRTRRPPATSSAACTFFPSCCFTSYTRPPDSRQRPHCKHSRSWPRPAETHPPGQSSADWPVVWRQANRHRPARSCPSAALVHGWKSRILRCAPLRPDGGLRRRSRVQVDLRRVDRLPSGEPTAPSDEQSPPTTRVSNCNGPVGAFAGIGQDAWPGARRLARPGKRRRCS